MQRRLTPPLILATLLLAAACQAPPPDLGPPPNVLLLVVDCLRADRLSVSGYERPTTPNIDALAAEGVRFTRAISQASWTRPSLPTILTGLYPSEHGLSNFDESDDKVRSTRLTDAVTTLAEALKSRGYRTAMIGEQFQLSPRFGLDQGFDFYKHRASTAANIDDLAIKLAAVRAEVETMASRGERVSAAQLDAAMARVHAASAAFRAALETAEAGAN